MSKLGTLLIATAAGVVAGILIAPKSGKETRADLMAKAQAVKTKSDVKAEQVKQAAKDGSQTLKKGAAKVADDASKTLGAIEQDVKRNLK